ncbi:sugar transferase [Altererythrobacter sp. CC-YST694]|uniref:sugar transferase n=1 Tax=Altererythrobacter sp. CC-YST694 TaxID=2755038 RepID=UPI001D010663|nr:sugar transferase [Altererythrobacter sp. CC-YST694]
MDGFDTAACEPDLSLTSRHAVSVVHALPDNEPALLLGEIDGRLEKLRRYQTKRRLVALSLIASDMGASFSAVLLAQLLNGSQPDPHVAGVSLAVTFPIYFLAALQTGAHSPSAALRKDLSLRNAGMAYVIAAAIIFSALFLTKLGLQVSRLQVIEAMLICLVLGMAARCMIARQAMRYLGPKPYADLCIYDDVPMRAKPGPGAIRAAEAGLAPNLAQPEMVSRLGDLVRGMDRVVVHCSTERREAWSRALKCVDIRSEIVMPELTELMPLDIRYRNGEVSLVLANGPLHWHHRLLKSTFDRVAAALALLLFSPLLLIIAIGVKLDSPGPILFGQDRIGLGNRRFHMWKFRSMKAELSDHSGHVSASRDDQRITRFGQFLRRTSLDELPQLFNVLLGQMSVVGPRPHAIGSRAEEMLFWDIDQRYWYRHSIKPGLTGLAQVRGLRGATHKRGDLEQRLFADLEYVANWSLMTDMRIIFQTFLVLVHRNAY